MASDNKKICPTCGTRIKEDADRCLVCGSTLNGTRADAQVVRGGRMPEITLGLPIAIGLVVIFLAIGAGMVYLALQQTGVMEATTITPTLTQTLTGTPTTTPEPPTTTPSPMPSPTPLSYVVAANDSCLAIAARFEVSIKSIVLLNNIPASCDTLFEGQELKIPPQ